MTHTNKSNSQSQDDSNNGHPLLEALSQFGRSFFLHLDPYPVANPPQNPPSKVITIWERLQNCETELAPVKSKAPGRWFVKRIEPKEPIDFLEYCRRKN